MGAWLLSLLLLDTDGNSSLLAIKTQLIFGNVELISAGSCFRIELI